MADADNKWNDDDDFDSEDGDFGLEMGHDTPNANKTDQPEQEEKAADTAG